MHNQVAPVVSDFDKIDHWAPDKQIHLLLGTPGTNLLGDNYNCHHPEFQEKFGKGLVLFKSNLNPDSLYVTGLLPKNLTKKKLGKHFVY